MLVSSLLTTSVRLSAAIKNSLLFSALWFCFIISAVHPVWSAEQIVLFTAQGKYFKETLKGLKDDLEGDVSFIEKTLSDDKGSKTIAQHLQETKPKMLVFLGNKPLQAYAEYQKKNSAQNFPPAIALSALYLDRQISSLKNINGIRHEIPAVTSLVQLRSIVKHPIKKVGVIYREWMEDFIQQNQAYCQQEDIELVKVKISNTASISKLSYHLKHLLRSDIDALWVANDNALLQPRNIQNAWIPLLKRFDKPVIVGIHALTKKDLNFGTFAVEADHYALGLQAAGMISDIMDNNWQVAEHEIEQPLSIKNILNLQLSKKKKIPLNTHKFGQIDQLIR